MRSLCRGEPFQEGSTITNWRQDVSARRHGLRGHRALSASRRPFIHRDRNDIAGAPDDLALLRRAEIGFQASRTPAKSSTGRGINGPSLDEMDFLGAHLEAASLEHWEVRIAEENRKTSMTRRWNMKETERSSPIARQFGKRRRAHRGGTVSWFVWSGRDRCMADATGTVYPRSEILVFCAVPPRLFLMAGRAHPWTCSGPCGQDGRAAWLD